MKTFLILLVGVLLGVAGYHYYQQSQHPTLAQRTGAAVDATKETAGELKEKVVEKSRVVGERVEDARIITAIKGKYVLDKDLSALAISVSCTDGRVELAGTVESDELIARAAKLARETSGVVSVTTRLTVRN